MQPHDPNAQNVLNKFAAPSWDHWLGTNDLGQDLWSRIMVGAGVALYISVRVVVLAMVVAVPIGLLSGYVGGRLDNIVMRLVDAGLSFPALVLAVAVAGVLGPGLGNAALAISIVLVPGFVRLTRGSTLAVTQETFVEASRAIGTSVPRMLWTRILPNVRGASPRGRIVELRRRAHRRSRPELLGPRRAVPGCQLGEHAPPRV